MRVRGLHSPGLAVFLALAACGYTDLPDFDAVTFAAEPAYARTSNGQVVATSCLRTTRARDDSFADSLPGCGRDTVFAAQVAHPAHLTDPARPGPAASAPIAAAANSYLYGGTAPANGQAQPNAPGRVVLIPPSGEGPAGPGGGAVPAN